MASKKSCFIPCADKYDKELTFLRAPDELDDGHEIDTRDWSEWKEAGGAYGAIATQGNRATFRQFEIAGQAHGVVDAIITTAWNDITAAIDHGFAIRIDQFGKKKYYHIAQAINVDENCVEMMFICRNTTPGGTV